MNSLQLDGYVVSRTITARIANAAGQFWHVASAAFETYGAGGHAASSYDVALTEKGGGAYRGNWPAITTDGEYVAYLWDSAITTQAIQLLRITVSDGAVVSLADLVTLSTTGAGDYTVTLTIRTTAGVPLAGVRVWLSTDNSADDAVTGVRVSSDGGVVTFRLDYATTYYIHGHLSGWRFAAASFTPAAGSVAFTKDIAQSALAAGSDSDYAEAQLVRMIAEVRKWADEPQLNAKYDDDWIIRRAENIYALVLGEKNGQLQDQVIATLEITPVAGTTVYVIPATMGPVQAIYSRPSGYDYKYFYERRGSHSVYGKGVWVEGNLLHLQAGYDEILDALYVECIPNGCARLHCGTCTLNADGDEATLGATPYLGTRDRAVNAYAGSLLRIFNVTGSTVVGNLVQERLITAYDAATRVATLAAPFDPVPTTDDGSIFYEIAPQIPIGLDAVLGMKIAWEIAAVEMPKKAPGLLALYGQNLRHLRLEGWSAQLQSAQQPNADAYWNPEYVGNVF